jgi:hypothetical protein
MLSRNITSYLVLARLCNSRSSPPDTSFISINAIRFVLISYGRYSKHENCKRSMVAINLGLVNLYNQAADDQTFAL